MARRKKYNNYKFDKRTGVWVLGVMLFLTILGQFKNAYNDYLLSQTPPLISPLPLVHAADSDGGTVSKLETVEITKLKINEIKEVKTEVVYVEKEEESEEEQIRQYIKDLWGDKADEAFAVLSCENNGLNPTAKNTGNSNGSVDGGIFQINSIHGLPDDVVYNWKRNIAYAYSIYLKQGWRPWTCAYKVGVKPFYQQ